MNNQQIITRSKSLLNNIPIKKRKLTNLIHQDIINDEYGNELSDTDYSDSCDIEYSDTTSDNDIEYSDISDNDIEYSDIEYSDTTSDNDIEYSDIEYSDTTSDNDIEYSDTNNISYNKTREKKDNIFCKYKNCKKCDICKIPNGYKIYKNMIKDKYFKNLDNKNKFEYIKQQSILDEYKKEIIPIKYKILNSNINIKNKTIIIDKINELSVLSPESSEYSKLKKWVDGITNIPFEKYANIPISINSTDDEKYSFLYFVYDRLNKSIYGQENAKNKILQIVSQWFSNPESYGNVIALEGPPGIGKTTLIKNGLSDALNIPFCFQTLGGANDASILEGHSFTYEGSSWGKIVDMLMRVGCMNPIIFFDELDKISMTEKGKEISGILTHLTDSSQNDQFHDVYFSGIDFDLSRSLMIFSYNNRENIDPILLDRITTIKLDGFNIVDKINISKKYLIPLIIKNIGLYENDIIIDDNEIKYIIEKYTNEAGVRRLKEYLSTIYNKINLLRFVNNRKDIYIGYNIEKFSLPIKLTKKIINKLLSV